MSQREGEHTPTGAFADFLIRRFAGGAREAQDRSSDPAWPAPSGVRPHEAAHDVVPDENDLAAYARGGLSPERRSALASWLRFHPELEEQIAFEAACLRGEQAKGLRPRRAALAAAALLILVAALSFFLDTGTSPAARARAQLAQGNVTAALEILEGAADQGNQGSDQEIAGLLATARFAAGDPEPERGLTVAAEDRDLLPLTGTELAALEPRTVRHTPFAAPALGDPRGMILDARPALTVQAGGQAVRLRLFRNADQVTVLTLDIPASPAGAVVVHPYPEELDDLEAGCRYGVELRNLDGALQAHADFVVADSEVQAACATRTSRIAELLADTGRRDEAFGHFYLRRGFYGEAVRAYRRVPASERSEALVRALDLAERLLWNR